MLDSEASCAAFVGETNGTHFIDTDVGLGAKYWYRVVPCNGFGDAALDGATAVAVTVEEDGADLYVDAASGDDEADGRSWANAKRSLRAVTPLLDEDDLVLVRPGRYEPIAMDGIRCEIRGVGGSDATFIDGGGTNRCARLSINTYIGTTDAVMTGFSLVNGLAGESGTSNFGGGTYGGTFKWCVVSNCAASSSESCYAQGGGSYYSHAWNSRFLCNRAISGGDSAYGGGAYYGDFYNCLFAGNEAVSGSSSSTACGGAIAYGYTYSSTIVGNTARNTGGGDSQGGGFYNYYHYGSILWDNTAATGPDMGTNNYSRLYYGCSQETNPYCKYCITSNPGFVDSSNGDWRLAAGSPCINAGYNNYARGAEDLQGVTRIQGGRADMGAFEGSWAAGSTPVQPLVVTTRFLPAAQVGRPYAATLNAAGGIPPYIWSAAPDGESISISSGGVLSATPDTPGVMTMNVLVTDGEGTASSATLALVVEETAIATSTTPVPVPYSRLDNYAALFGPSLGYEELAHAATGKRNADGSPTKLWEEYVAGTDPTNIDDCFRVFIRMDGMRPVISWEPDLNANGLYHVRDYTVWGKASLLDDEWHSPTNGTSRIFKVTVDVP